MAKMTIDNPNMLKLLPQFMRDDDAVKSLTFSMDALFAEPGKRAKIVRKWDQINNMNHAQLNEMPDDEEMQFVAMYLTGILKDAEKLIVHVYSEKTAEILENLGFKWGIINKEYIQHVLQFDKEN